MLLAERAAVNASPLIFLARGGLTLLLKLTGPEVVVPQPVAEEVRRRGAGDPTVRALEENPWPVVTDIPVRWRVAASPSKANLVIKVSREEAPSSVPRIA